MTLADIVGQQSEIIALKKTTRYDTCQNSMQESTADHTWGMVALIPPIITELKLSVNELQSIKIAIYHDIPEYPDVHDIDSFNIARGKVSKQHKQQLEEKVMTELLEKYGGQGIYDIWQEYEAQKTPEAKFVKAMDKIESLIHMAKRGATGRQNDDDHTVLYADKAVQNFPAVTPLLKIVKSKLKTSYEKQGLEWKPAYDEV